MIVCFSNCRSYYNTMITDIWDTWDISFKLDLVQLCETQKISLNNPLVKNIPDVGSFWHFVICYICVFCICICTFVFVFLYLYFYTYFYFVFVFFVFACLTLGNNIFDIIEQSSFQTSQELRLMSSVTLDCQ